MRFTHVNSFPGWLWGGKELGCVHITLPKKSVKAMGTLLRVSSEKRALAHGSRLRGMSEGDTSLLD